MSRLIYLSGKSRAGKDEFAKFWIKHNPSFIKLSFADEIKKLTSEILGISKEELDNPSVKEKWRPYLIFGGKLGRKLDPDIWVKKLLGNIEREKDYIITDVRFKNEKRLLDYKALFNKVYSIRVESSDENRIARGANPLFFNDVSETELDPYNTLDYFHWVLENNSTLEELERQAILIKKAFELKELCREK